MTVVNVAAGPQSRYAAALCELSREAAASLRALSVSRRRVPCADQPRSMAATHCPRELRVDVEPVPLLRCFDLDIPHGHREQATNG